MLIARVHFLLIASLLLPTFFLHSSAEQSRGSDQQQEADKWPQNNPGTLNVSNDLPWVKPAEDDSTSAETNSQESWEQSAEVIEADGQEGDVMSKNSKWPQNYPGGGGGGNFHPNKGRGPFFPGHIGHWPGRHEWEDENGHNREHQGKRGEGGHHGNGRRQEKGWLDWIFPWRKSHRHNKNRTDSEENDDGNNNNSTRNRNESVLVHLRGGPVRGLVSYAAGPHRPANVFKGIPFAEPPIGKLRFKPLQKKRAWKRVWDATKYTAACLSNTTRTRSPQHYISEDCIYMNVFADPKCHEGKPCPVLFYVHGGGFAYDSATMFNDTQIVQKYASDGVVFLIPAYRLGLFGFLDLGSDRTVKRNLGLHDIIFALSWTRREVRAFGGDPERITIMGNSAGASAVQYLCASPAVEEKHFQQAIISSGVPFFVPNANLNQTYELLDHFNCLRHNSTNRTLSDKEKADCLREQNATDLLRAQQRNEERGIVFSGPETDSELLPAKNYVELLRHWTAMPVLKMTTKWEMDYTPDERLENNCADDVALFGYRTEAAFQLCMDHYNATFTQESEWEKKKLRNIFQGIVKKARPVIYSTTKNEFARWPENRMRAECWKALIPLGYSSQSAFQACMDRYNQSFFVEEDMRVSYESMHAESFLTSLVNTRLGGISYVGEFELANYSNHADDLYFFFGLHYIPLNTTDSKLMDIYYPKMIKNFLRGHAPDQDWKPQNWNGRNFFRIAFNVSQNGTLLETPHGVDGYQDIDGLQFWLRDMAVVERNARWQKAARQMHGDSKRGPGNLTESEERTWREVFGDGGNRTLAANETTIAEEEKKKKKGNKQRRHLSPLPMANSFLALPPIDEVDEEEENGTSTNAEANGMEEDIPEQNAALDSSTSTPQSTDAPASDMPPIPVVDDQQKLSPMPLETANNDNLENEEKVEAAGRELSKVWSAFWLTISITVLLSVAMVLMVVTKVVHRYKNVRGYSPAPDGTGMFSEKTRIIQANGNNNHMRYI